MMCPKCGFEQPQGVECIRCGVIFSRLKGASAGAAVPPPPPAAYGSPPAADPFAVAAPAGGPFPSEPYAPAASRRVGADVFEPPPSWTPSPAAEPPLFVPPPPPPPPAADPFYGGLATPASAGTLYEGPPAGAVASAAAPYRGTGPGVPQATFQQGTGDFSTGSILGQTFSIFFANLLPFLLISLVIVLPLFFGLYFLAASLLARAAPTQTAATQQLIGALVLLGATVLASPFATAALTYGVFQEMRGKPGTVIDCLRVGLASLLPVIFVALLQGLLVGVGFLFCIVPGLIVAAMLAVSVPAAVEERPGILGALQRSAYLTEGYRGAVFGVLFVIGAINQAFEVILGKTFAGPAAAGNLLVFEAGKQLLIATLSATAAAVMYYRLRSIKESIGVEDLVSIFD
jgi:hypothetical protein